MAVASTAVIVGLEHARLLDSSKEVECRALDKDCLPNAALRVGDIPQRDEPHQLPQVTVQRLGRPRYHTLLPRH